MKPILLFLLIITLGTANESDVPSPPLEMWLVKNKRGQVDHLLMGTEKDGDKILLTYKHLGIKVDEIPFMFKIGPGVELQAIQTAVLDAKKYHWKSIGYIFLTEGFTQVSGRSPATWSAQQKDAIRTWLAQAGVTLDKAKETKIEDVGWTIPEGWMDSGKKSSMIRATLTMKDDKGLEIIIMGFQGDVGGELANVNRWHNQVGLPPVKAEDLSKSFEVIDSNVGKAKLLDISNGEKQMIMVVVYFETSTYFFKLLGKKDAVSKQKESMIKLVKSLK